MLVKFKDKEYDLKFSFNSFNFMENFDMGELQNLDTKPFKMIGITKILLMGAFNNNPHINVTYDEVDEFLEEYIIDNNIADLLEELIGLLEDSSFFKSLQKKTKKNKK